MGSSGSHLGGSSEAEHHSNVQQQQRAPQRSSSPPKEVGVHGNMGGKKGPGQTGGEEVALLLVPWVGRESSGADQREVKANE